MDFKSVGVTFANVYYNKLCAGEDISYFYFPRATGSITFATNRQVNCAAREEIGQEFGKLQVGNVTVSSVTCQEYSKECIIVVVAGKMTRKAGATFLFNQTFVLRARRTTVRCYAVANDVLVLTSATTTEPEPEHVEAVNASSTNPDEADRVDESWESQGTSWGGVSEPIAVPEPTQEESWGDRPSGSWEEQVDGVASNGPRASGEVPDQIEKVDIQPVKGSCNAVLTWKKPSSKLPLTGYRITAFPSNVSREIGLGHVTGAWGGNHAFTITGLLSGRAYQFTVSGINEAGIAPPSPITDTVSPKGPPLPPVDLQVAPGDGEAVLWWANNPDTPVTAKRVNVFTVSINKKRAGKRVTTDKRIFNLNQVEKANDGSFKVVVPGLTNGVAYAFQIQAENKDGISSVSAETEVITPTGPPPAPKGIRAKSKDKETIAVMWDAPPANVATENKVDHYLIEVFGADNKPTKAPLSTQGNHKSITIKKLAPNTTYQFKVLAVGPTGTKSAAAIISARTEDKEPLKDPAKN